jgi:hypothetical protein
MRHNFHIEYQVKSYATKTESEHYEEDSQCLLAKIKQEMKDLKDLVEELTAIKKKGKNVP